MKRSTPPSQTRQFSSFTLLLGSFILVLLLFAAAEIVLRIINPDVTVKDQSFPLNREVEFTDIYKADSRLFWRFRPDDFINSRLFSDINYTINSHGMRNPEFSDEPHGYRILALGNSCTFGWGVEESHIWARQLEAMLRERYPDKSIEVINAGVPGYSSFQGKRYFADELVKLKPNMVLIMFGWNDQWTAGKGIADKDQKEPPQMIISMQNLLKQLKLYAFLRKLLSSDDHIPPPSLDDVSEPHRVSLTDFAINLKEIITTARQNNIQPVLMIPPVASLSGYFNATISNFHSRHALYQKQIADIAEFDAVPLVNLQPPFDQFTNLYDDASGDPIHFNAAGHLLAAQVITDIIAPLVAAQK